MKTQEEIRAWLVDYLARMLSMEPASVDVDKPVQRYGLDSAAAVELTCDLGDWLGTELEPTIVFEHRTIRALSDHVAPVAA